MGGSATDLQCITCCNCEDPVVACICLEECWLPKGEAAMSARQEIEAGGRGVADGVNNKDAASIASLYTADACLLPPGAPRQDGREAIQAYWQAAIDMGLADVELTTIEVEELGDMATDVGSITATLPGEDGSRSSLSGKYIVLWQNGSDGTWRMHRDIWNFDA